jgi:secreted PhoX family phosphatase
MNEIRRREFLKFMGYSAVALGTTSLLSSCDRKDKPMGAAVVYDGHQTLKPNSDDDLVLAEGLKYHRVIDEGQPLNAVDTFGFNNDYIAYLPESKDTGILWVNHEYLNPLFIAGLERTKANIDKERLEVGGSMLKVERKNGRWGYKKDEYNERYDGTSPIPFAGGAKIKGSAMTEGTLGNCAGGVTPWNTFLTCEENYYLFYGEREEKGNRSPSKYGWEKFYPNPPEHYGWVVEIDPKTKKAQKHTSIGRFAHECCTCVVAKNGNTVAYSGDDKNYECLYKFVADKPNSLESGTLYVANLDQKKWISLDIEKQPALKKRFKDQLEVLTYAREAAKIVGGTPLDRPEDIEIHPKTGDIFITLTNNKKRGNFHGHIMKISENNKDYLSDSFEWEYFLTGGEDGFSCPDNMAFDQKGNLWFCSDISGQAMHKRPYKKFKNNGLFVVPVAGEHAGKVLQIGSAPVDAELTGLCFDPEEKSLFLSVQHPGEQSKSLNELTSHWPDGKGQPRNAVVSIYGPLLESLTQS